MMAQKTPDTSPSFSERPRNETFAVSVAKCILRLTYKCDPHGESCAVNTEVLQDVIFHETQDGEAWSITCMVDLQKYTPCQTGSI